MSFFGSTSNQLLAALGDPRVTMYGGNDNGETPSAGTMIPKWLADMQQPTTPYPASGIFGVDPGKLRTAASVLGNTSYGLGDYIYSGAATGGNSIGENAESPRMLDLNSFIRYQNSPAYQQAMQSGKWSILNGTPYDVLDANGNVIGQRAFDGLHNEDNADNTVMALTGMALGGIAAFGGAGGAAGAAGAAGGGGAGAGAGAGALDLGGGITMGADGAIGGGVGFTPGLSNAAIEGMAAGSGYGGSLGAGALDLGGGLSMGADGSIMGATPGAASSLSNSGIQSMIGAGGASGGGGVMDLLKSGASSLSSGGGSNLLGLGATALGALGGAKGQDASTSSTKAMDPRMDALFYGDLAPRTQGLLGSQLPAAYGAGSQMMQVGSGLLGQTAPNTPTNPYLKSIADDMQRRTSDLLGANNLAIQGNAVGTGGLGGSRQGVAQGTAAAKAADYLQGNVAGLYGNAYTGDQNRLLQQQTLGAGLLSQGLNTQFQPLQNSASVYSPFTGFGTTTNNQQSGGGWQGALGGALGAAQLGKNAGWW